MRALALALWAALWPGLAAAGAWPRAPGEVYVATGQEAGEDGWTSLYAEYGGPWGLTYGLDVGGHVASGLNAYRQGLAASPEVDGRVMAFVRVPIAPDALAARLPAWVASALVKVTEDAAMDGTNRENPSFMSVASVWA